MTCAAPLHQQAASVRLSSASACRTECHDAPEASYATSQIRRASDLPQAETGSVRFSPSSSEHRSRERILLESVLQIALHGRTISTGYHAELRVIATQAATRLKAVAA